MWHTEGLQGLVFQCSLDKSLNVPLGDEPPSSHGLCGLWDRKEGVTETPHLKECGKEAHSFKQQQIFLKASHFSNYLLKSSISLPVTSGAEIPSTNNRTL